MDTNMKYDMTNLEKKKKHAGTVEQKILYINITEYVNTSARYKKDMIWYRDKANSKSLAY